MRIHSTDTRLIARIKMMYLVPINLVLMLPVSLWIGLAELVPDFIYGLKSAWNHQPRS